ncbi:MAG TPA: transglycosylase SLT domain-containing protein, partial [Longimicrobiales bacterium]|nr:transglycosylase SLT domain-containing protein [Longimicrobiales bacterium]
MSRLTGPLGRLIALTRRRAALPLLVAMAAVAALTAAGSYAHGASAASPAAAGERTQGADDAEDSVQRLLERARRADTLWAGLDSYWDAEVAPLERVLRRYKDDPDLARRVAVALVREAHAVDLEPRLLLAVLLVENPWIDPQARSPVGAVGLMQVMPLHRGNWRACP